MDILKITKPVSPEEAFDLRPVNKTSENSPSLFDSKIENNKSSIYQATGTMRNDVLPVASSISKNHQSKPFIEANTEEVNLYHLKNDCIIPVFSKDNEKTIAHQEFIEIAQECASKAFLYQSMETPEIRVSHQIKGRTPDAIHKNVKDLLDHEKTIYYERMAFIIRITGISDVINGNELSLTIEGVRAYNQENLYNKKSFEKFKFFIGF